MSFQVFLPYLLVMAGVTYLIRMLPLTLMRRPIRSRFLRSFLHYVPYAVLTAMVVPDILYSTGYVSGGSIRPLICAVVGMLCAVVTAWKGKGLLTVAIVACVGVAAMQGIFLLV